MINAMKSRKHLLLAASVSMLLATPLRINAEAVKAFELNARSLPDDPNVHDGLGEGYMQNGQKSEAVKSVKRALAMDPLPGVRANSIKCLKQLGVDTSGYETAKK